MIECKSALILNIIAQLILKGNVSGYYPYWELTFSEFYKSWHFEEEDNIIIAQTVISGGMNGVISKKIKGKKVQINWYIRLK